MNFLAHYLLSRHRDSPEFHLGAILPDFGRRAGIPLQPSAFAGRPAGQFAEMLAGMHLHWHGDRLFHNSELFTSGYQLWKTELESGISGVQRKFFLYHLLFEMWLDRILMQAEPEAAAAMYQSLLRVDEAIISEFSQEHAADPELKLLKTTQDFSTRKFVLQYEHPDQFAGIASGVFAHATRQLRSEELRLFIGNLLPQFDRHSDSFLRKWETFRIACLKGWAFPY